MGWGWGIATLREPTYKINLNCKWGYLRQARETKQERTQADFIHTLKFIPMEGFNSAPQPAGHSSALHPSLPHLPQVWLPTTVLFQGQDNRSSNGFRYHIFALISVSDTFVSNCFSDYDGVRCLFSVDCLLDATGNNLLAIHKNITISALLPSLTPHAVQNQSWYVLWKETFKSAAQKMSWFWFFVFSKNQLKSMNSDKNSMRIC